MKGLLSSLLKNPIFSHNSVFSQYRETCQHKFQMRYSRVVFITRDAGFERDPKKRRVKPGPTQQSLFEFDLGESSDDSDFRIEDHCEESDDDSIDSDDKRKYDTDDGNDEDSDEDEDFRPEPTIKVEKSSDVDVLKRNLKHAFNAKESLKIFICCSCLGDRSDDVNEIVECDGCGVTVHEGCYGVSDTASVSSTVSSCSTAPWFCEACRAGVTDPSCELCPNRGGIFKETDVGKWVHLVCALYVPGVAFGEVDKLSSVTVFEMPYTKWGNRVCSLCEDQRYGRTGACIECDAGMCRSFFHVTCAQREGLLAEAHSEEADQAEPFYGHCKMHTDRGLMRRRRRNWLALQLRTEQRRIEYEQVGHNLTHEQLRIKRKLAKYRQKYLAHKGNRIQPWVPTQKMARMLTTSVTAIQKLCRKTELMGINMQALELEEEQIASLVDVRKKWHIPPALNVEYVGYFFDREQRIISLKQKGEELSKVNTLLQNSQQEQRCKYDHLTVEHEEQSLVNSEMKQLVLKYHSIILRVAPHKKLPDVEQLCKPLVRQTPISAAQRNVSEVKVNGCGICRQTNDQHLLAKCDACYLFYHLGCLNPPLTRMPKKTKLMGWQCSECDKESSGSEVECPDMEAPRKLRHKENEKHEQTTPKVTIKPIEPESESILKPVSKRTMNTREFYSPLSTYPPVDSQFEVINSDDLTGQNDTYVQLAVGGEIHSTKQGKKRRREKHHRYSPSPIKEHKRKRKRKSFHMEDVPDQGDQGHPRIKIKIKPIPRPTQEGSPYGPQMFVATSTTETMCVAPIPTVARSRSSSGRLSSGGGGGGKPTEAMSLCKVCKQAGSNQDMVKCDECMNCYHFTCLDPPVKKSPKRRGYSWHCADCDPTETESDNGIN